MAEPPTSPHPDNRPPADVGVVGNERLTALAGGILLVLAVIEIVTVPALRSLLSVHFFVGVLLVGPVAVKTASTGWRFVRYYTHHPAYRRKGPPRLVPRVLAPLLLVSTLAVLGSGIALAVTGPAPAILVETHLISFLMWLVTIVIHVVAYVARLPRLIAADWQRPTQPTAVPGRRTRLAANIAALLAGTAAAVLLLPTAAPWSAWLGTGLAKVLLLYALVAVITAVAVMRLRRHQAANQSTTRRNVSNPELVPATRSGATSTLAIETQGLSKRFGKHTAVDGLTIRIPAGTIAGFVGPNGAGKTTTIRLLLGLVRPNAGTATVLDCPLTKPDRYLPRVGALIEAPAFYPSLSGRTNLEILARLGGYPRSRVNTLLELVELSDRARDRVRTYSLGMKQRLGVAMALLPDPDLLILDEPANGLDPLGIIGIRDLLRRLRDQGKTILLSSHLLGELEQVTDWLVMLHQGKVLVSGPARDLLAHYVELVVEADDAAQLDLVARIVAGAGHAVTRAEHALHIACPAAFAETLNRQARAAGLTELTVRVKEVSLEQLFLALVKGDQS